MRDMEYELTNIERTVRRNCVKTFLDLIILTSLKNKEMSGYEVMTSVYDKYRVLLSAGTVYTILHSLKIKRLIQVKHIKRKKVYTLTEEGRVYTNLLYEEYDKFYNQLKYEKTTQKVRESYISDEREIEDELKYPNASLDKELSDEERKIEMALKTKYPNASPDKELLSLVGILPNPRLGYKKAIRRVVSERYAK